MRNNPVMLIGAAALLVIGGAAFQAQATMGDFSALAKSQRSRRQIAAVKGYSAAQAPRCSASRFAFVRLAPLLHP